VAVLGDILQITLRGEQQAQLTNNVFFYRVASAFASPDLELLGEEFEQLWFSVDDTMLRCEAFAAAMDWTGYRIINLFNELDLVDVTFSSPYHGGTSGELMPPMVAIAYQSEQVRRDIRRGQKRFAGLVEAVANGGVIEAAFNADLTAIASGLGQTLVTTDADYSPVVVQRVREVDPVTDVVTYRLPTSQGEAEYFVADAWTYKPNLTTQNTRKIGRGA